MRSGFWAVGLCVFAGAIGCGGSADPGNSAVGGGVGLAGGAQAGTSPGVSGASAAGTTSGGGASNGGASNGGVSNGGVSAAGAPSAAAGRSGAGAGGALDTTDYGSGACPTFEPCGGNVVGDWKVDALCTDPKFSGIAALCPAAVETYEVSGPLSFHADGTVVSALQLTFHDSVPASCVATLGGCGVAGGRLASCTANPNGGCECDSPSTVTPPVNQRYVASGNQLLLTDDDNTSLAFYCQSGNQLEMRGKSAGTIFQYSLTRM